MDNLKPMTVDNCRQRHHCYNFSKKDCRYCNIWNYLYDIEALIEFCKKQNMNFMLITMDMQKSLES